LLVEVGIVSFDEVPSATGAMQTRSRTGMLAFFTATEVAAASFPELAAPRRIQAP
jgi:hypothetical protein